MTDSFRKEGIITDEEREIVRFGLESLGGNLLSVVLILIIGICFKQIREALFLWLLLFPLRKNAGGYHAATKVRCLFASAVVLIISFVLFTSFENTMRFYGICTMAAGCVIWILAPVDNFSKKLDAVEYKEYRRRTRIALVVEGVIFVLALFLKWETVVRSICMTLFIVSVSLLVGVAKLMICNKLR